LERHVHHLVRYGALRPSMEVRWEDVAISSMMEELDRLHFQVRVWLLPVCEDLYAIAVLLDHPADLPHPVSFHGRFHVAIHSDLQTAVERAITECLLSRVVGGWRPKRMRGPTGSVFDWRTRRKESIANLPAKRPLAVARIARSLGVEAYWADLTLGAVGIPVVRVLVPGWQPNFDLLGQSPLDPRSRITGWLKPYPRWMRKVRKGQFEAS
jgi:ribosomal protein S12 methylthiotransferase accessory factor YcaO